METALKHDSQISHVYTTHT